MRTLLAATATLFLLLAPTAGAAPFLVAGGGDKEPAVGVRATEVDIADVESIAPTADGGLLVAERNRVLEVGPTGLITTVAGSVDEDVEEVGIPGPADGALIRVGEVAALPDGGFLIADNRSAVLRVSPDGQISYDAGQRRPGYAGDGGPATAARLRNPGGIALLPDGGYLVADSGNDVIRRVAADGTITTAVGGAADSIAFDVPVDVAALDDGGFLVADQDNRQLWQFTAAGTGKVIAGNGKDTPDATVGARPTRVGFYGIDWVTVEPDGTILFEDLLGSNHLWRIRDGRLARGPVDNRWAFEPDGGTLNAATYEDRVHWEPGSAPKRIGVDIHPATTRLGARTTVRFSSTLAGEAEIVVARGNTTVKRVETDVERGDNAVALPGTLAGGRHYRLTVTVTGPEGQSATDALSWVPRGPLSVKTANAIADAVAAEDTDADQSADDAYEEFRSGSCVRVSATRADCQIGSSEDDIVDCDHVIAIFLPKNGQIYLRQYRCPQRRGARLGAPLAAPDLF